jgi:hypothetical protein
VIAWGFLISDCQTIRGHQPQCRIEHVSTSDINGFRLARLIFLESGVEDNPLGIREHEVTFLNTGRQKSLEAFVCHAIPWPPVPSVAVVLLEERFFTLYSTCSEIDWPICLVFCASTSGFRLKGPVDMLVRRRTAFRQCDW